MDDHTRARQFNADLDRLMRGETPDAAGRDASLDTARTLLAADYSAQSRIRHLLRRDLIARMDGQPVARLRASRRRLTTLAGTLAIVILAVLLIPPLRSFAQDIIRQIGQVRITSGPTDAERYVAEQAGELPTATPNATIPPLTPIPQVFVFRHLTPEQASQEAGFAVYVPDYLPEGFVEQSREIWMHTLVSVTTSFYVPGALQSAEDHQNRSITLEQVIFADEYDFAVGDAPTVELTVNGNPGLWVEDAPVAVFGDALVGLNLLFWAQDGFNFQLTSRLPQDEALKIANSLHAIDYTPTPAPDGVPFELVSQRAASTNVGFVLDWLRHPPDGYELLGYTVLPDEPYFSAGVGVYRASDSTDAAGPYLLTFQSRFNTTRTPDTVIGDGAQAVTVRDQPGWWVEGRAYDTSLLPDVDPAAWRFLYWSEGGFEYVLQSNSLGLDALIEVADLLDR
jgi:hypothetical protein